MSGLSCKRCNGASYVKNGIVRGHQRYKCRDCGCNFTNTPPRGKPPAMKALAVLLYGMGNMSYGMIARLFGVSDVAVYKWIRSEAAALPEPSVPADVEIVQLDERWHFVNGKKTSAGSGAPSIRSTGEPWPGFWVSVTMQPAANCSTRSASGAKPSVTDDREGYHRCIPEDRLFTGKDLTFAIEQDNSNIRHHLARFRRGSKVTSRPEHRVDLSLRLHHHLHNPLNFREGVSRIQSIFS
jgi:transposase-like protein